MSALSGKAIVITGAGAGLGAAYARHAASLGAKVLVNDVSEEAATRTVATIRQSGGIAIAHVADVAKWHAGQDLVERCIAEFGTLSGFVANAGILRHARLLDIAENDLRRMFEINVMGTAAGASAAAKAMLAQGAGGSIVTVTSGAQAGDIALGGYGASKAAVAALTFSWAMELAGTGMRLNAVSPLGETALAAQNHAYLADQQAIREIRYGALPCPDISAPVVSFLLSDAASGINGQVVRIADRELSFVSHPLIADPVLKGDWTFEEVSEAFAECLQHRQHKLGLAYATPP